MKRELYIDFSATDRFDEADYYLKLVLRRAIFATLEYEKFPLPAGVSVTLCDNGHIHALNKQYRGVDRPTDVLSFPLYEDGDFSDAELLGEAELGDIVLSLERAKEQAEEYGHSFEREVAFLCVHSMLHLLGYDHETSEEDEIEMRSKQTEIMKIMGLEVK